MNIEKMYLKLSYLIVEMGLFLAILMIALTLDICYWLRIALFISFVLILWFTEKENKKIK